MKKERKSGVLLHPSSLPGKFGIGTLGEEAYSFVDFLIKTGQTLWQVLPLGPTGYGDSPYNLFSSFAGNHYLIDLEYLLRDGLLIEKDLKLEEGFELEKVEFGKVIKYKEKLLNIAFENYKLKKDELEDMKYNIFVSNNSYWIDDYSLFRAIKEEKGGKPWFEWEDEIKFRNPDTIKTYKLKLKNKINYHKFVQYYFNKQWLNLKSYANNNNIKIIGDIPMYVAYDSADVWTNPEIFQLDSERKPVAVAGVPPDYFSETGQLWGNPLYNWDKLIETDFEWMIKRLKKNKDLSDILRFDHFRAFSGYWSVPYGEETAINGEWKVAYGDELFEKFKEEVGEIPVIAEDLGFITDDVIQLKDKYGYIGMKVLQFAFDSDDENDFLPHNHNYESIVYTGSLDNNTIVGWYKSLKEEDKEYFLEYINTDENKYCWEMIRTAWSSTSKYAITTMQDILELDEEHRMNTPGTTFGNWQWRFKEEDISKKHIKKLLKFTKLYKRR